MKVVVVGEKIHMQNAHCSTDARITMFGFLFSICGFRLFLQLTSPVAIVLRADGKP